MIIHSLLPNPNGPDNDNEWVKIFNDGDLPVSLSGWQLKNSAGKSYLFPNATLKSKEFLTLRYQDLKFALKNSGDTLMLYDGKGQLADTFRYIGYQVKEGLALERDVMATKLFENFPQNFGKIEPQNFSLSFGWIFISIALALVAVCIIRYYEKKWQ